MVGVAVGQVEAARAGAGGFEVGGQPGLVQGGVVGVQQRGAGALSLAAGVDGEDGEVVCDTRSHAVSELVEEVWLMPGT